MDQYYYIPYFGVMDPDESQLFCCKNQGFEFRSDKIPAKTSSCSSNFSWMEGNLEDGKGIHHPYPALKNQVERHNLQNAHI